MNKLSIISVFVCALLIGTTLLNPFGAAETGDVPYEYVDHMVTLAKDDVGQEYIAWSHEGEIYFATTLRDGYSSRLQEAVDIGTALLEEDSLESEVKLENALAQLDQSLAATEVTESLDHTRQAAHHLQSYSGVLEVDEMVTLLYNASRELIIANLIAMEYHLYNGSLEPEIEDSIEEIWLDFEFIEHTNYSNSNPLYNSYKELLETMNETVLISDNLDNWTSVKFWSEIVQVSDSPYNSTQPHIFVNDTIHLGWAEEMENGTHVFYARSTNGGETWWYFDATENADAYMSLVGIDPTDVDGVMHVTEELEIIYISDQCHYFYVPIPVPDDFPYPHPPDADLWGSIDDPYLLLPREKEYIIIDGMRFFKPSCVPDGVPFPGFKAPDLVIENLQHPHYIFENEPFTISADVVNMGDSVVTGRVEASFTLRERETGQVVWEYIDVWDSGSTSATWVPSTPVGVYDLAVKADPCYNLMEGDEYNNEVLSECVVLCPEGDYDEDGIINSEEDDTYYTDPIDWDTDGDLIGDGDEVNIYGKTSGKVEVLDQSGDFLFRSINVDDSASVSITLPAINDAVVEVSYAALNITSEPVMTLHRSGSLDQGPEMWGDVVIWSGAENGGPYQIWAYDISDDVMWPVYPGDGDQIEPSIYDNLVVWTDYRDDGDAGEIYLYDLANEQATRITNDPYDQYDPDICGDTIVWTDDRNQNLDIYSYDLVSNTESPVCTERHDQAEPAVSAGYVVWSDLRNNDDANLWAFDRVNLYEIQVTTSSHWEDLADISGNVLVYRERDPNVVTGAYAGSMKAHDLMTNSPIATLYADAVISSIEIRGNTVLWTGLPDVSQGADVGDVYIYDIGTGTEHVLVSDGENQVGASLGTDYFSYLDATSKLSVGWLGGDQGYQTYSSSDSTGPILDGDRPVDRVLLGLMPMALGPGGSDPTATIDSIMPDPMQIGESVTLTGSATGDTGRSIVKYRWRIEPPTGAYDDIIQEYDVHTPTTTLEYTPLYVGEYRVRLRVWDDLGADSNEVDDYFDVIGALPTIVVDSVSRYIIEKTSGVIHEPERATIAVTAQSCSSNVELDTLKWYIDDDTTPVQSRTLHESEKTDDYNFNSETVGTFDVHTVVTDAWGSASVTVQITVVDYLPPYAEIISVPASGIKVNHPFDAEAYARVEHDGYGLDLDHYEWLLDGSEIIVTGAFPSNDESQDTYQISIPYEGEHTLTFRAYDENYGTNGLYGDSGQVTVFVDPSIPPTVSIDPVSPSPVNKVGYNIDFLYQTAVSELDAALEYYEFYVDDVLLEEDVITGTTASITTHYTPTVSGVHFAKLKVRDSYQAWGESSTTQFEVVDFIPPMAIIDDISPDVQKVGHPVTFYGFGEQFDPDLALSTYDIWVLDPYLVEVWSNSGSVSDSPIELGSFTPGSEGLYSVYFQVFDVEGHPSEVNADYFEAIGYFPPEAYITDIVQTNDRLFYDDIIFKAEAFTEDPELSLASYAWKTQAGLTFLQGDIVSDWATTDGLLYTCSLPYNLLDVGTHAVYLEVTDSGGNVVTSLDWVITVIASQPPVAGIVSITPSTPEEYEDVGFEGDGTSQDGAIIAYKWFSDVNGEFITVTLPTSDWQGNFVDWYSDLSEGWHDISFSVQDERTVWSTPDTVSLYIEPNPHPTVTMSIGPNPAYQFETVYFDGTLDDDEQIAYFEWTIDGAVVHTGTDINDVAFDTTYLTTELAHGPHSIGLEATDNHGESTLTEMELVIHDNVAPTIDTLSVAPATSTPDMEVSLDATVSDFDGTVTYYEWRDDVSVLRSGDPATLPISFVSTLRHGSYDITLEIRDDDGATASMSQAVLVNFDPVPVVTLTSATGAQLIGREVIFSAAGTYDDDGDPWTYYWSLGDGSYSTDETFSYLYSTPGTYEVILTVSDLYVDVVLTFDVEIVGNARVPVSHDIHRDSILTRYDVDPIYPSPSLDVGDDGTVDWSWEWFPGTRVFNYDASSPYPVMLTRLFNEYYQQRSDEVDIVQIPLTFSSSASGYLTVDTVDIHIDIYQTNPTTAHSDADGWNDSEEVFFRATDPTNEDTDADGLWDDQDGQPHNVPPTFNDFPDFTAEEGEEIDFTTGTVEDSDGIIIVVAWDLGNGYTRHLPSFKYAYPDDSDTGVYTGNYKIYDNAFGVSSDIWAATITDRGPSAEIIGPSVLDEGTFGAYTGEASQSYPDEIVSYRWDFDYDLVTFQEDSNQMEAEWTWMTEGTYHVVLIVVDDDGTEDWAFMNVTVQDVNPTADIAGSWSITEGAESAFHPICTQGPDGIQSYDWNFGDGVTLSTLDPTAQTHLYGTAGNYDVTLQVDDGDGPVSVTKQITVSDFAPVPPVAVQSVPVNDGTEFTVQTSVFSPFIDDLTFVWDFGDGTGTVTVSVPRIEDSAGWDYRGCQVTHTYASDMENRDHTITVVVTDDDGSQVTISILAYDTDLDNDGLSNEDENTVWFTNPNIGDTDDDGFDDLYEVTTFGNIDNDNDGFTNPIDWDSDGDWIKDGEDIDPVVYTDIDGSPVSYDSIVVDNSHGISVIVDYDQTPYYIPDIRIYDETQVSAALGSRVGSYIWIGSQTSSGFTAQIRTRYSDTGPSLEEDLAMYYLSEGHWRVLFDGFLGEDTGVDVVHDFVWAKTTHFSVHAIGDTMVEDSDNDGFIDGEERHYWDVTHNIDWPDTPTTTYIDTDKDGIVNLLDGDSDGDTLLDGNEFYGIDVELWPGHLVTYTSDPANPDSDGDIIIDADEIEIYKTDPTLDDTDGDLMDSYEVTLFDVLNEPSLGMPGYNIDYLKREGYVEYQSASKPLQFSAQDLIEVININIPTATPFPTLFDGLWIEDPVVAGIRTGYGIVTLYEGDGLVFDEYELSSGSGSNYENAVKTFDISNYQGSVVTSISYIGTEISSPGMEILINGDMIDHWTIESDSGFITIYLYQPIPVLDSTINIEFMPSGHQPFSLYYDLTYSGDSFTKDPMSGTQNLESFTWAMWLDLLPLPSEIDIDVGADGESDEVIQITSPVDIPLRYHEGAYYPISESQIAMSVDFAVALHDEMIGNLPSTTGYTSIPIKITSANPGNLCFRLYGAFGLQYWFYCDPFAAHSDSDGLTDSYELFESYTNPNDSDSDGDSLWDGWQDDGGNTGIARNGIQDGDEANGEQFYSTDPLLLDTDGDKVWDGEEHAMWTDVGWYWDVNPDTQTYSNNLRDDDADHDHILDGHEYLGFVERLRPMTFQDVDQPEDYGWIEYDGHVGGQMSIVYDDILYSYVLQTTVDDNILPNSLDYGIKNPYDFESDVTLYDSALQNLRFHAKICDDDMFQIYVRIRLKSSYQGTDVWTLTYQPTEGSTKIQTGTPYVIVPIGEEYQNGKWHTVTSCLVEDLVDAGITIGIEAVTWVFLRGDFRFDTFHFYWELDPSDQQDTDGDGLTDGIELEIGTIAGVENGYDSDGDGWNDGDEYYIYHTDPRPLIGRDTDGDGEWDATDIDPLCDVEVILTIDWVNLKDAQSTNTVEVGYITSRAEAPGEMRAVSYSSFQPQTFTIPIDDDISLGTMLDISLQLVNDDLGVLVDISGDNTNLNCELDFNLEIQEWSGDDYYFGVDLGGGAYDKRFGFSTGENDGQQWAYDGSIQFSLRVTDSDGDGLPWFQELAMATDPNSRDTDGDGIWDREMLYPDFQNDIDSRDSKWSDSDGDRMSNMYEINQLEFWKQTEPDNDDTDEDEINDDLDENPRDPENLAIGDNDLDGIPNNVEIQFDFDPNNPNSPGLIALYDLLYNTLDYDCWKEEQYADEWLVMRRGDTIRVNGPNDADLYVTSLISSITDPLVVTKTPGVIGEWTIHCPVSNSIGKYSITLLDKTIDLYVIFELPTDTFSDGDDRYVLTDAGRCIYLYDENNCLDDISVVWAATETYYKIPFALTGYGFWSYLEKDAKYSEGYALKFVNRQYKRYVLDKAFAAVYNDNDIFDVRDKDTAADELQENLRSVNHIAYGGPTILDMQDFIYTYPGSGDWHRAACNSLNGALTAFLRSIGIPARPVMADVSFQAELDFNDPTISRSGRWWYGPTYDHSVEAWINGNWYVLQGQVNKGIEPRYNWYTKQISFMDIYCDCVVVAGPGFKINQLYEATGFTFSSRGPTYSFEVETTEFTPDYSWVLREDSIYNANQ